MSRTRTRTRPPIPTPAELGQQLRQGVGIEAHDGDTCLVRLDLLTTTDETIQATVAIRIADIDAAEVRANPHGPADPVPAQAARTYLEDLIVGRIVFARIRHARSFNRYVADLYTGGDGALIDVGAEMVRAGHAVRA